MLGIAPRALYTLGKYSTTKLIPTLDSFLKKALRTILNINFSGNVRFCRQTVGVQDLVYLQHLPQPPPHTSHLLFLLTAMLHKAESRVQNSDAIVAVRTMCLHHFQGQRKECLSLTRQEGSGNQQNQAAALPSVAQRRPRSSPGSHFPACRELRKAPGSGPASAGPAGLQPMPHPSLAPGTAPPGKLLERVQNHAHPVQGEEKSPRATTLSHCGTLGEPLSSFSVHHKGSFPKLHPGP